MNAEAMSPNHSFFKISTKVVPNNDNIIAFPPYSQFIIPKINKKIKTYWNYKFAFLKIP